MKRLKHVVSVGQSHRDEDRQPFAQLALAVLNLPQNSVTALSEQGPLASRLKTFVPRSAQQRLSYAVAQALIDRRPLLAEVGTGTGKTFAYLVPVLLSGLKTVISTGTRSLQDQLFQRDLPRVEAALGVSIRKALLKGRTNYLCRYRLEQRMTSDYPCSSDEKSQLFRLHEWSRYSHHGDIAELEGLAEQSRLLPWVTSTNDNCLGSECPFWSNCFVLQARQQAQAADLIVVNHHLLLADIALKHDGFGDLLPHVDAFIVDEAHQIPELAGQFFGETISTRHCQDFMRDCLAESATVATARALLQPPLARLEHQLLQLRAAMDECPDRGTRSDVLAFDAINSGFVEVLRALNDVCLALDDLRSTSTGLSQCFIRAEDLYQRLQRWLYSGQTETQTRPQQTEEDAVLWYALSGRGIQCYRTPIDVSAALQAQQKKTSAAWVFTSATLVVNGQFDQSAQRLGLEQPRTLLEASPFQWRQQALCYLPVGLPDPDAQDYCAAMIAAITPILEASNGRALLLFTAHRALQEAARLLSGCQWPLFVQGQAPRSVLLQRFSQSGNGVLLGTASFREGIDVAGEALSVVVLDRLPFASPKDPVMQARFESTRRQGRRPFEDVQLPQALMIFKQSLGRLLRSETDRGAIVVCDPRIRTRSYGQAFLRVLPELPITKDLQAICDFLRHPSAHQTLQQ